MAQKRSREKKVTVITGGAGGMGLATAEILGRDHHVVLCDVDQDRLDQAVEKLGGLGISCESLVCDITDSDSVDAMLQQTAASGTLRSLVHTAGLSPQMADAETIMRVNAVGTINITNAAFEAASEGFALVNIASMAAHMLPGVISPHRVYRLASSRPELFLRKMVFLCRLAPTDFFRSALAYGLSKDFVIWFSKRNAARFGERGARVVSVSPGSFDTAMGRLEEKSGSAEMLKKAALKRFGRPEEIAEVLAFCASDKASYLTGTDILCDGGVIAGRSG